MLRITCHAAACLAVAKKKNKKAKNNKTLFFSVWRNFMGREKKLQRLKPTDDNRLSGTLGGLRRC